MIIHSATAFYQQLLNKLHNKRSLIRHPQLAANHFFKKNPHRLPKNYFQREYSLWHMVTMPIKLQLMASFGKENRSEEAYTKTIQKQFYKGMRRVTIIGPISLARYLMNRGVGSVIEWMRARNRSRNHDALVNIAESESYAYFPRIPRLKQLVTLESGYDFKKVLNPLKWLEFFYALSIDSFARRITMLVSLAAITITYGIQSLFLHIAVFNGIAFRRSDSILDKIVLSPFGLISGLLAFAAAIVHNISSLVLIGAYILVSSSLTVARNLINLITSPMNGFYRRIRINLRDNTALSALLISVPTAAIVCITLAYLAYQFGFEMVTTLISHHASLLVPLFATSPVIIIPAMVISLLLLPILFTNIVIDIKEQLKGLFSVIEQSEIFNLKTQIADQYDTIIHPKKTSTQYESVTDINDCYLSSSDARMLKQFGIAVTNTSKAVQSSEVDCDHAIAEKCFAALTTSAAAEENPVDVIDPDRPLTPAAIGL